MYSAVVCVAVGTGGTSPLGVYMTRQCCPLLTAGGREGAPICWFGQGTLRASEMEQVWRQLLVYGIDKAAAGIFEIVDVSGSEKPEDWQV